MEWKDATSYSKHGERVQNVWMFKGKVLTVKVVKHHRNYPGEWIMHCRDISISDKSLGNHNTMTLEQAQQSALSIVKNRLSDMVSDMVDSLID